MPDSSSLSGAKVWVAGHNGMVGSAIVRRLEQEPVAEILGRASYELDLRRQAETEEYVAETRPDVVILAAAKVGGILANSTHQADFLYDNLAIGANVIEACRRHGVRRLVVLGSSCIYPRLAPQPIREDALLTGPLEPTNEGYALAKIATLEMAKLYRRQYGLSYVSLMPTNLYGPNDNFDLVNSHVLPAMIRKFHDAKVDGAGEVTIWGSGKPMREFLHVDDLADATVHVLDVYDDESHVNVGTGKDITIADLAALVAETVGWEGRIVYDSSKPDGTPRKCLDVSLLHSLGWQHRIGLREGLASTYQWFLDHHDSLRGVGAT